MIANLCFCEMNIPSSGMNGLTAFISDIRKCTHKAAEIKRINKELANIRSKFKGDKALSGYHKKKYICKLIFIFLLGYDIELGRMEAVNLLMSDRYSEKQIGYLYISVVMNQNTNLMPLIIKFIKDDLSSCNGVIQNLALQYVANMPNKNVAESVGRRILEMLLSPDSDDFVRQSAALSLARLLQIKPDLISNSDVSNRIINFLNHPHLGLVTSSISLIEVLAKMYPDEIKDCIQFAVSRLSKFAKLGFIDLRDYSYHYVAAPWLSVKLLRLLQHFSNTFESISRQELVNCLHLIFYKASKMKEKEHHNAKYAVLIEAIYLTIHVDEKNLLIKACGVLSNFLRHSEANLRFLALEVMCRLAKSEPCKEKLKEYQNFIFRLLKNKEDTSIHQKAADFLFMICDESNVGSIVKEMLNYLEISDFTAREKTVLKVATIIEKFRVNYLWYVDVVIKLIVLAGDEASEEVWHKLAQNVNKRKDVQGHTAKAVFDALKIPACHENMIKLAGYILGEYGNLIANDPSSKPTMQLNLLHSLYATCSAHTKPLLLTTFIKFASSYPEIKSKIQNILKSDENYRSTDVEIQQRSVEYLKLSNIATPEHLATVVKNIPSYKTNNGITLETLRKKRNIYFERQSYKINHGFRLIRSHSAPSAFRCTNGLVKHPSYECQPEKLLKNRHTNVSSSVLTIKRDDSIPIIDASTMLSTCRVYNEIFLSKFIHAENGVLYEDDMIHIFIESKFHHSIGGFLLTYMNKTKDKLLNFSAVVTEELKDKCVLQWYPCNAQLLKAKAQQVIQVECLNEFDELPFLNLRFLYNNIPRKIKIKIPLYLNKFIHPYLMKFDDFMHKWRELDNPLQQTQRIFEAKYLISMEIILSKLKGFHLAVLENEDRNADKVTCAGIFHTRAFHIECFVELGKNQQNNVFNLIIRSNRKSVSEKIAELLQRIL